LSVPEIDLDSSSSDGSLRLIAALVLGSLLWLFATIASQLIPQVVLGLPLKGINFGIVGLLQAVFVPFGLFLALRPTTVRLQDLGLTSERIGQDALLGLAIATTFFFVQFFVIFPQTGGSARSDIATNSEQIGSAVSGVAGFIVLAWTGGFAEELFFRGFLLTLLLLVLGRNTISRVISALIVTVVFAALHGYQGWAGIIDTGLYGGLLLSILFLVTNRLTACIVAHATWNTLATVGLYMWY
jgi:uncharacterized protein